MNKIPLNRTTSVISPDESQTESDKLVVPYILKTSILAVGCPEMFILNKSQLVIASVMIHKSAVKFIFHQMCSL